MSVARHIIECDCLLLLLRTTILLGLRLQALLVIGSMSEASSNQESIDANVTTSSGLLILNTSSAAPSLKSKDVPRNVVVLAGMDRTLDCASGNPYRWYKYRSDNPTKEDVIWMGDMMASRVNQSHIHVYREPNQYPYDRLDLRIMDVHVSDAGTYKCTLEGRSLCAELIIIDSEPKCMITKDETNEQVALECDVTVTYNGEPDMQCINEEGLASQATCSTNAGGVVRCVLMVSAASRYTCNVKIKSKPRRMYKFCSQATNDPEYCFTWKSKDAAAVTALELRSLELKDQSVLDFLASRTFVLVCLIIVPISLLLNVITIALYCVKQRKDRRPVKVLARHLSKSSTPPPQYDSLLIEAPAYSSIMHPTSDNGSHATQASEYSCLVHTPCDATQIPEYADLMHIPAESTQAPEYSDLVCIPAESTQAPEYSVLIRTPANATKAPEYSCLMQTPASLCEVVATPYLSIISDSPSDPQYIG